MNNFLLENCWYERNIALTKKNGSQNFKKIYMYYTTKTFTEVQTVKLAAYKHHLMGMYRGYGHKTPHNLTLALDESESST